MPIHPHFHDHSRVPESAAARHDGGAAALRWALAINAAFLVVEFAGGLLTNSLALLADAGHMLTDVAALGVAIVAGRISSRLASPRRTYGYGRVKVLATFLNGLTLWLIVGVIIREAVQRMIAPPEVRSLEMLLIAAAGLIANVASAAVLRRHQAEDINIRGAFLHLMADSLGSVAAIVAGAAMLWRGWYLADPISSVVISLLILVSSLGILRDTVRILLEGAPGRINLDEIRGMLEGFPGVLYCHDLHIWLVGSDQPVLTAHLVASPEVSHGDLLAQATCAIRDRYGIAHATLQIEPESLEHDLGCEPRKPRQ